MLLALLACVAFVAVLAVFSIAVVPIADNAGVSTTVAAVSVLVAFVPVAAVDD